MVKKPKENKTEMKARSISRAKLKCRYCSRSFMMEWARQNHEKVCWHRENK